MYNKEVIFSLEEITEVYLPVEVLHSKNIEWLKKIKKFKHKKKKLIAAF